MQLIIVIASLVAVSLAQTTQYTGFVWPTTQPAATTTGAASAQVESVGDKCKKCLASTCSTSKSDFCNQSVDCNALVKHNDNGKGDEKKFNKCVFGNNGGKSSSGSNGKSDENKGNGGNNGDNSKGKGH